VTKIRVVTPDGSGMGGRGYPFTKKNGAAIFFAGGEGSPWGESQWFLTRRLVDHTIIKLHEVLDGRTPAEACGIKISGDSKWMTLIQNAATAEK